ncbi:hypothetical protein Drose_38265 [Dactylosporangium roseum]|uniref:Uncharacterized protein n=1 Tax=Dactylosporangium roseum TaxID=47989 RepID=A0ABY5Z4J6_9ACTN|nr:hypothetical protein [Dactylosporangium roseum]UWZ36767.1 hypothetical protein Drose_38265 [Dactylosporangium roseum]
MGIDANGYCTQCRTYRGVPQAPQPPTSGSPYSGAPYSGGAYAGYPSQDPSFPDQVSGPGYPGQVSGPGYPGQVSGPPSYPPTTYGGQYGASPTPPKKNNFLVPVLALSGVLVLLVVAIVVVAAMKGGDDPKDTPVAQPGQTTNGPSKGASAKPSAIIDECLVGSWQTKTYTEQVSMQGIGDVPFKLDANGAVLTFTADGKHTQTFKDTRFSGDPTVQGTKAHVVLTVNANVTADVHTAGGSIAYTNLKSDGSGTVSAPSLGVNETEPFSPGDDPSKYTCSGDTLTLSTARIQSTLTRR